MSEKQMLRVKNGFIQSPKDGEEGAWTLNSMGLRCYRFRIGIMRKRDRLIKERNIHAFSGSR
jgi:hypothetical protein